jgi:hypothetical protein
MAASEAVQSLSIAVQRSLSDTLVSGTFGPFIHEVGYRGYHEREMFGTVIHALHVE